jgi:hypothetical protein
MMAIFERFDDYNYIRWAQEVKRRDHYSCVICGRRGELNSHHLNSWNDHIDERYEVENGVTLCTFHHRDFHSKFGKGNNTSGQFEEYREVSEALIKVARRNTAIEAATRQMIEKASKDLAVEELIAALEKDILSQEERKENV